MLPDGNGLDVLARLKQKYPTMGVILLSALGQETDKVRGLNLGADDYVAKPFGVLELAARVNAPPAPFAAECLARPRQPRAGRGHDDGDAARACGWS